MPAGTASSGGAEQIAQRPIPEEVEGLVGDLEPGRAVPSGAGVRQPVLAGLTGDTDEPLFRQSLDDALNQRLELVAILRSLGLVR